MAGNAREAPSDVSRPGSAHAASAPKTKSRKEAKNSVRATTATWSAGYLPAADARDTMCRRTSFKLEEMSAR